MMAIRGSRAVVQHTHTTMLRAAHTHNAHTHNARTHVTRTHTRNSRADTHANTYERTRMRNTYIRQRIRENTNKNPHAHAHTLRVDTNTLPGERHLTLIAGKLRLIYMVSDHGDQLGLPWDVVEAWRATSPSLGDGGGGTVGSCVCPGARWTRRTLLPPRPPLPRAAPARGSVPAPSVRARAPFRTRLPCERRYDCRARDGTVQRFSCESDCTCAVRLKSQHAYTCEFPPLYYFHRVVAAIQVVP